MKKSKNNNNREDASGSKSTSNSPNRVNNKVGGASTNNPPAPPFQDPYQDNSRKNVSNQENEPHKHDEDEVIQINLTNISHTSLPTTVKLKDTNQTNSNTSSNSADGESHLEIIIHPSKSNTNSNSQLGKQVWRKREVVKQEKTIHYTTVDDLGVQQELIERETTQTEVLHMECRDTGERKVVNYILKKFK